MTERCLALPRTSVVIATTGRDTLQAAVDSARDADEIIVVGERCDPQVVSHHKTIITRVEGGGEHRDVGQMPGVRGVEVASGSHIAFLGDDDAYVPGAFDLIRETNSHSFIRPP